MKIPNPQSPNNITGAIYLIIAFHNLPTFILIVKEYSDLFKVGDEFHKGI
ncbi:hypothetical protein [uncultured Methanobrevibacter sp.]|nr:hypothetical protein [uncultured Methanobrevibacter sp.]